MSADPHPEFRCRCCAWGAFGGWLDEFNHRCPARPTQEDGLCDHCRQPQGGCGACGDDRGCCRHPKAQRLLVDLLTPCMDKTREAVPF